LLGVSQGESFAREFAQVVMKKVETSYPVESGGRRKV